MSYFTKVGYSDTGSLDAFSRLRVSNTETLFSVQSQYNTCPIEMEGGATFTAAPTWTDVNTTYSGFEYGTGGTFGNLTSGIVIASGYIQSGTNFRQAIADKINLHYPISLNRAGAVRNMGTLSILVQGIGNSSASRAAIAYTEIR